MNNEETLFDGGSVKEENEAMVGRKKNSNTIKMAAAAVSGAAVGVGATYASQASAANVTDSTAATTDAVPTGMDAMPRVAIVDETKDFTSAFNEARNEVGAGGVFEYRGTLYNTYTEEDWDNMTQEEKDAFAKQVQPEAQQVEANYQAEAHVVHTSQPNIHSDVESSNPQHSSLQTTNYEGQVNVEEPSEDNEIHVLAVEHNVNMEGDTVDVAAIEIDGHQGVLIDVDQNGVADVAAIDINNNGQLDNGEVRDISQANLQMPEQTPGDMYMASADDMPDYTNDASLI